MHALRFTCLTRSVVRGVLAHMAGLLAPTCVGSPEAYKGVGTGLLLNLKNYSLGNLGNNNVRIQGVGKAS